MAEPYVISWCKQRKFFGRTGDLSHVLLDKGVLCVPDESHEEFLSAYARGVVQGGKHSCIVEYKPKIFRMFYDLDIVANNAIAKNMTDGSYPDDVLHVLYTIIGTTADSFDVDTTTVTSCISNIVKKTEGGVKVGIHLTFDSIFVTSAIALHVRAKVLKRLEAIDNPFANTWNEIVDAAVHKGSGMRLPWAAKPGEPNRVYVPRSKFFLRRGHDIVEERIPDVTTSFAETRSILASVSLRSKGNLTKLVDEIDMCDFESPSYIGSMKHSSVLEYASVIEQLEELIPQEYVGRITGVVKTEHAFMFRHSSKYCANVGRHHNSSNTYFLVSRSGMSQRCYSRKIEFDEKVGSCSAFKGNIIDVPSKILFELFPPEISEPPSITAFAMPTNSTEFTMDKICDSTKKKQPKRAKTTRRPSTKKCKNPFALR
jgi:hypothetical protein